MLLQTCLFALLCVSQVLCNDKVWDNLVVKWGSPRAPDPNAFNAMPRTSVDARKEKWTELDDGCKDKKLGFLGKRFIHDNQADVLLIFDKNGFIAGIQMAVAKDVFDHNEVNVHTTYPPIVLNRIGGKNFYVLTAYFVPVEKICQGRTANEFRTQGTGTTLFFLNGTDTLSKPVYQPLKVSNALTDLGWMKEKCVPTMGLHYFNDFRVEKDCAETSPFALLFDANDNQLVGFNYFVFGNYPSNRFEFPPKEVIRMFADPLPACYSDAIERAKGLTALHVYFISKPQAITCV